MWHASDSEPGELLARGRAADVYELDATRVLRRYRNSAPFDTEREARLIEHVRSHGFPTPAVHDVAGTDMVFERVDGPTMADDIMSRPWKVAAAVRALAALHERLHAIPAPDWLRRAPAGDGTSVVHLDLHPLNVLVGRDGPVVIDWTNAARGPGGVDVALTWLLLRAAVADDHPALQAIAKFGRRWIARAFARAADPHGDALRRHRVAAARYRLTDPNLPGGEPRAIRRLVPDA